MSQETVVPQDLLRQFNGTLVYRGKFNGFISQGEYFITREDTMEWSASSTDTMMLVH